MKLIISMAARSLLRSKLSLVLLTLAVAAGVGFQIPNAANLDGYTQELLRHGVLDTGHVQVTPAPGAESIPRTAQALTAVEALPFVRGATARLIHAGVLLRREARHACRVVGIDPAREQRLCRQVGRGRCLRQEGSQGAALVGDRLAERLGLKVGDRVRAVLPVDDLNGVALARLPVRVAGILDSGGFSSGYDLVVPRATLSRLLEWGDEATVISVQVDDHAQADAYAPRVAAAVNAVAPDEGTARAASWREANEFVTSAVEGNQTLFGISMTMVIVAVGIPVLALLYIHVLQERRQIAIFAALGFSRGDLFMIYLVKALLLGVAGVAAGIAMGLGLCAMFSAHPIFEYQGFVVQPSVGVAVVALPAGILLLVTLLAGLAPAIRAARANPALELKEIFEMTAPVYQAEALGRTFGRGGSRVAALDRVSFTVREGEYVAFTGPSGSGKTTLLNILGLLDPDFDGQLQLCGQSVGALSPRQRAAARLTRVGFVFQQIHLLPALSVLDNVALPRWRLSGDRAAARRKARELLEELGLGHRLNGCPDALSAGEKQRAALARALINDPALVLADEPTGNLDAESTRVVLELLARINAQGRTVVVISHDPEVVAAAERVIRLRYGRIDEDPPADRGKQGRRQGVRRAAVRPISARASQRGRAPRPAPCATPRARGRGGSDRCGRGCQAQAPQ